MGPRCAELEVQDPRQYHFNPDSLLLSMVTFMARLAEQPAFVRALSAVSATPRPSLLCGVWRPHQHQHQHLHPPGTPLATWCWLA